MARYHFLVKRAPGGSAIIAERFITASDDEPGEAATAEIVKAMLTAHQWELIAEAAAQEFNSRLVGIGRRSGRWLKEETPLAPYFGKELTLLAWAVEDDDGTLIPKAVANWRGLAPEERWWFYTTINATVTGSGHGRDRGWRQAIKIAFADNPVDLPPSSLLVGQTEAVERAATRRAARAKKVTEADAGKLRLFD